MKSLTYISEATAPLDDDALYALENEAARLNALDGITGLLLYNGVHFAQTVQGMDDAIDDLMARLARDPRHHTLTIVEEKFIDTIVFPTWEMKTVAISADVTSAKGALAELVLAGPGTYYSDLMVKALTPA